MACAQFSRRFTALRNTAAFKPANVRPAMQRRSLACSASDRADTIKQTVSDNKVVVYSKTYCPYCSRVKGLLGSDLKLPVKIIELDQMGSEGSIMQSALQGITGMRTVPQVFIGGKLVGGCDDTVAAYQSGQLKELLAAVDLSI